MRLFLLCAILLVGSPLFAANSCVNLFLDQSAKEVSINGSAISDKNINKLIQEFKEPVIGIEVVDGRYKRVYFGQSVKEQYQTGLEILGHWKEIGILSVMRAVEPELRERLMKAKNSGEFSNIFLQHFLKKHQLKDLKDDFILDFDSAAENINGIRANLNSTGAVQNLKIGPLSNGLYILRLHSKDTVKEVAFKYGN